MKALRDFSASDLPAGSQIAKKGRKYIAWVNGELRLSEKQADAIVFGQDAEKVLATLCVDTRNAQVVGRSYDLVSIAKK